MPNGSIAIRAGYFGLCARHTERGAWVCGSGGSSLDMVLGGREHDPLNAIGIAAHFKDDVVLPAMLYVLNLTNYDSTTK